MNTSKVFSVQGMRESNSHQRFWRPLSYHLTNPLYCLLKSLNSITIKEIFVKKKVK